MRFGSGKTTKSIPIDEWKTFRGISQSIFFAEFLDFFASSADADPFVTVKSVGDVPRPLAVPFPSGDNPRDSSTWCSSLSSNSSCSDISRSSGCPRPSNVLITLRVIFLTPFSDGGCEGVKDTLGDGERLFIVDGVTAVADWRRRGACRSFEGDVRAVSVIRRRNG